jgi:hypothetical protein
LYKTAEEIGSCPAAGSLLSSLSGPMWCDDCGFSLGWMPLCSAVEVGVLPLRALGISLGVEVLGCGRVGRGQESLRQVSLGAPARELAMEWFSGNELCGIWFDSRL